MQLNSGSCPHLRNALSLACRHVHLTRDQKITSSQHTKSTQCCNTHTSSFTVGNPGLRNSLILDRDSGQLRSRNYSPYTVYSGGATRGVMLRLLVVLLCLWHLPASRAFPRINVLKQIYGGLVHKANPLPSSVSQGAQTVSAVDNSQTCPKAPGFFFSLGSTRVRPLHCRRQWADCRHCCI